MEDQNPQNPPSDNSISKRTIIRPGTPLAAAIAAIKAFDTDYVQKGHKTGQYHYRTYEAEDGTQVNVWHTETTVTAVLHVPSDEKEAA